MSIANNPEFWRYQTILEEVTKAKEAYERLFNSSSHWKPNREFQEHPPEGVHVQFFAHGSTYVGQRDAEGNWKDVIWGREFVDAEVQAWANLLGKPEL